MSKENPILAAATEYMAKEWDVIPLGERSKEPLGVKGNLSSDLRREMALENKFTAWKWKSEKIKNRAEAQTFFNKRINIGVALGDRSHGLFDLDFDQTYAAMMANHIFSNFPVFGRSSAPNSHRIGICPDLKNTVQFGLNSEEAEQVGLIAGEKAVILEIRGSGGYTMFPPSTHPSGELLKWDNDKLPDNLPEIAWETLLKYAKICAFLAVVLRKYPTTPGQRDNICFALAGALLRTGMSPEQVDELVVAIAHIKGDEEADKRRKAFAISERLAEKEPAWGLPKLCELLGIQKLQDKFHLWLHGEKSNICTSSSKETIVQRDGYLSEIVSKAEASLVNAQVSIYQYGETLVRTGIYDLSDTKSKDCGITRQIGSPVLIRVSVAWLTEKMSQTANWVVSTKEGEYKPADPKPKYAAHLLARTGEWNFNVLNGLINTPTLRADGSILQQAGYDQQSKLLYDPAGAIFPEIPLKPSKDQALAALEMLENLFKEFPFVDDAARSVPVAGIITGLIRKSIPTAPMLCFDAPTAGTGKSMIAETIGIIVTGHKPPSMSQGKSLEEDEKRLATALMSGDQTILFDNCVRPIEGDFLCSMLTQEFVQARILGKNERTRLPSNALLMATGNNLIIAGDMTRRTLLCRMDAKIERPEDRQFNFDPRQIALTQRPRLVVAALTILRAYIHAKNPCPLPKIGSFEEWNIVRESIVWLGRTDPAETRQLLREDDPRKTDLIELLTAWVSVFGEKETTINQVRDLCEDATENPENNQKTCLYRILQDLSRGKKLNHWIIGRFMTGHKDRVVAGMVLRKRQKSNAVHWRVEFTNEETRTEFSNANQAIEIPF